MLESAERKFFWTLDKFPKIKNAWIEDVLKYFLCKLQYDLVMNHQKKFTKIDEKNVL